ncbi:MAG: adenylyltransferase/cytidyltransferase family protein [Bacteroidales bacterium]|nr:adenylyltransferase/cytidyltransferase family protein [Bacteroidales bacterium]
MSKPRKVFVSGCFDLMHSGHVAFLNEAAGYGDVYVALGSDKTINELKGRETINSEQERKYMLENLKSVKKCIINSGSGILDFLPTLDIVNPDVFVVNEDGHTPEKGKLCGENGIDYIVLNRIPHAGLPRRSTTSLRTVSPLPYRIDMAGTWIDQPYVSKYHKGSAIVASLEPTVEFFERSGMATSTRKHAIEMWPVGVPIGKPEKLARQLFRYDNPPSQKDVSGSQDALGIVMPGINRISYEKGEYWPSKIESIYDEDIISWVEDHIYFHTLWPRKGDYKVLSKTNLSVEGVKKLADAAENCWNAILKKDLEKFGHYFLESFHAQIEMFPLMVFDEIEKVIDKFRETALGWKLSGAGGGGYLILVSEKPVKDAMKIKIRRKNF